MSQYFMKSTLLLIYRSYVDLNNKLYTMHGTHIKIYYIKRRQKTWWITSNTYIYLERERS
jgi:hypothetical protein